MRLQIRYKGALLLMIAGFGIASANPAKEFLTDKEIESVQEARVIEARVKVYMEAAELRLQTAEDRLAGKESAEGDPMEFFSPEEMLDAYYQIIKSVISNVGEAFENPNPRREENIGKALKLLKSETEKSLKELAILKRLAEEKKKEALWNRINEAIAITNGAHEGAEEGLSQLSDKNPR
jgi:hypothetical protein